MRLVTPPHLNIRRGTKTNAAEHEEILIRCTAGASRRRGLLGNLVAVSWGTRGPHRRAAVQPRETIAHNIGWLCGEEGWSTASWLEGEQAEAANRQNHRSAFWTRARPRGFKTCVSTRPCPEDAARSAVEPSPKQPLSGNCVVSWVIVGVIFPPFSI